MDKKREEEFEDDEKDLTRDAFFADMADMEEEIASEAYELVEHAINLINSQYYDDGIEILRQAIGLYTQINREAEIKAIYDKISEIYLLKEKVFREIEIKPEIEIEAMEENKVIEEGKETEVVEVTEEVETSEEAKKESELLNTADKLIVEAHELANNNNFEEALDKYDEAERTLEELNKTEEVERLFSLIEECYNKKAEYLRNVKIEGLEVAVEEQAVISEERTKEKKLEQFLEAKKKEEELSTRAYEILDKAVELAKVQEYDEAIKLYSEGISLFEELKWDYEVNRIRTTIEQLENEKISYLKMIEKQKVEIEQKVETELEQEKLIIQYAKETSEQERLAQMERLKGIEFQKMEQEFFKAQINNMATEAAKMAREYEIAIQKAIKSGEMVEECIYPKVIEIYNKIKELLIDKGWNKEAEIYDDTIDVYIQKFENDKKIRQIEAEKLQKHKEAEKLTKIEEEPLKPSITEEQKRIMEEQRQKAVEIQNIRTQFENMTKRAERLAREYEVGLRQGKFELKCPYSEIIDIFKKAKRMALERGCDTDVKIFSSQIYTYNQKLEKDKKLRQIEAEKIIKQEEIEELLRVKKEEHLTGLDAERLRILEEQKKKEEEKVEFEETIDTMINRAEKMAQDYNYEMKKAIKKRKLAENPPFLKIIGIYERVKQMLLEQGREREANAYSNRIDYYSQKLEQDNKLREIEAKKAHREKALEEMHKMGKKIGIGEDTLNIIKKKKEQENFENYISENVNRAEKMVRDHEMAMRKAYRQGKVLQNTPYKDVIKIYKELREKVYARGWYDQAEIYASQIKIYHKKLDKHQKLIEKETEKAQKEKEIEEMHKIDKNIAKDEEKTLTRDLKKEEEKEFQNYISEMVNKAEKLERDFDLTMKKVIKKGKIIEQTPYSEIIEIYKQLKDKLEERGWIKQSQIYANQIKICQDKAEKHKKLLEVEAHKAQRGKEIEEMHKIDKNIAKDEEKTLTRDLKKEEEKEFQNYISEMVNKAEKLERDFDSAMKKAIKKGKVIEQTPYSEIIEIYKQLKVKLEERDWIEQSQIYMNQIKIYQDKAVNHEKLLEVEAQKTQREKYVEDLYKKGKIVEMDREKLWTLEKRKEEEEEFQNFISEMVNKAEKLERDFDSAMKKAIKKGKVIKQTPYSEIIELYKQLKVKLEERGWIEQSQIYTNQIKIYQDKAANHERLLEIEAQKAQREKEIEEMHKLDKKIEIDEEKTLTRDLKKEEEKEFQNYISEMVNKAEKLERDFDSAMKKAIKKGKVIEQTPYSEIIGIYKQLKVKLEERGWIEQSQIYMNQIKIYQDKAANHEKLLEVEAEKARKEKDIEEMYKMGKTVEMDREKLSTLEKRKEEEEEFQNFISEMVNKAEKLERDFDSTMKKAMKKGKVIEQTPYSEIIEIYKQLKEKLEEKGWREQSQIYTNQIKIYQDKAANHEKLLEVEAQKAQREKEIGELQKAGKKQIRPVKPERVGELESEYKKEEILLDKAMNFIDDAEKAVKKYELSIKSDILLYESPYEKAISNYEEAKEIFREIGWNDEAKKLTKTIKFYKDKKEKDDNLREIEQKKLEESEIDIKPIKISTEKEFLERQKRIAEFEEKQKLADETTAKIFDMIQDAEKMAQEYELKLKEGFFDFKAPYEKIIEIYRNARKQFEKIDWKEESVKLIETIKFYKEKLIQDKKIRVLEEEKAKKREAELRIQQRLLEEARQEQEKLLKKRKETLDLRKERIAQFETEKDKAFRLMDQAKRELRQNNFDKAIELYKNSEIIFTDINWEEGIKMVRDSVVMINNKKKAYELEQKALEERKAEKLLIEEKLEEKLAEAQLIKKQQQEEKRKEFLKIQREKEGERKISEEAYELLEQGTTLMENGKFTEAYDKYIEARELFQKISWQREVSRINNELLFKLKREEKQAEIFEEIKLKRIEEEKQLTLLKEQAKKERKELERKMKEERKEEAKRELDKKISIKLDKANRLIDNLKYNEGILIIREEIQRLEKLEKYDEIERIKEQIKNLKTESEIPLITIDLDLEQSQNDSFIAAYEALDEANLSAANNSFMKAISELNEAKFKLKELKFDKKIIKEIDKKISEFRRKLGKKPLEEYAKTEEEIIEDEMDVLRRRIAARREERRKKVLELLGKSEE